MSEFAVLKFGGSSAAAPEQMAEVFLADPARNRIAMLSAIGRHPDVPDSEKVTDMLIGLEGAVARQDVASIAEIQEAVIEVNRNAYSSMLGEKALRAVLDNAYKQMHPERSANGYRWIGEDLSARLFAGATGAVLVSSGLRFDRNGQLSHGKSLYHMHRKATEGFGPGGSQVVMPAFFGYNENRQETTLPRGGSDISAVMATAAMQQGGSLSRWVHENYTDQDGVMNADPDIVPDARPVPEITHEETREFMHGSAERNGVIHGDAIALAAQYSVNLVVRNTFNPDCPGTSIVSTRESEGQAPIIGISGKPDVTALNVYDVGMADTVNYLTPILAQVGEDSGLSISRIPMSEDGLKLIFNGDVSEETLRDVRRFIERKAVSSSAKVTELRGQGEVYLVGQELRQPPVLTEALGQVASALSDAGLGFSEAISREDGVSIVLTVPGDDVPACVQTLHRRCIEEA